MNTVTQAIDRLKSGEMIILTDDHDREDEADIIIAGQHITPQQINFLLTHVRGTICLSMSEVHAKQIGIQRLAPQHSHAFTAPFGMPIDAVAGISTGVSATDRATTIAVASQTDTTPEHICVPGHIATLIANPNGVLARRGHTEASVDLMKLAGLNQAAVICEIVLADGSMARGETLKAFAKTHQLPILSIEALAQYRKKNETLVKSVAKAKLPTKKWPNLVIESFYNPITREECVAIYPNTFTPKPNTRIRVHSSCFTGDLLQSLRCDCGTQLHLAMDKLVNDDGVLIYLNQEGRGIGLAQKVKAYALQEQGIDTVDANLQLGFKADARDFFIAAQVIKQLNIPSIILLTNNANKTSQLRAYGIEVNETEPLLTEPTQENKPYLQTKQQKMGHQLNLSLDPRTKPGK